MFVINFLSKQERELWNAFRQNAVYATVRPRISSMVNTKNAASIQTTVNGFTFDWKTDIQHVCEMRLRKQMNV